MSPREDRATAAEELLRAVELVQRYTPPAFVNDVAEIRRRVGWIVAGLDDTRTCERCGGVFRFADAELYARERMPSPRCCPGCRRRGGR